MLYLNETLTGTVHVHPHDRFIRCRIGGAVFQGDAAGALWHGCRGAADFSSLQRIELARMFGQNNFRESAWPQGVTYQHDVIRTIMEDVQTVAVRNVSQACAGLIGASYHPDNSWVPIVKALDAQFGRQKVQEMFDDIARTDTSERFEQTKEEIIAGDTGQTSPVLLDEPGEQWQFRAHRAKRAFRFNVGGRIGEVDFTVLPGLTVPGDLQELEEKVAARITQETDWRDLPIRIYIGNPDYMGSWQIGHWDGDFFHELT